MAADTAQPPAPRVDIASLAVLRIAFGAVMVWEVLRYFAHGWIERYWIEPDFHFTYLGFGWVTPWPGAGMHWHFGVLGVAAACVMLGLWYRVASVLLALGFTCVFLLEQARYLNHFYLILLVAWLLAAVPAHRAWSLDAWRRPALRSSWAPRWALWVLRFQVGTAYVGGGLAKLNADWLAGEPMGLWLARRADRPVVGPLFHEEWVVAFFSYGGLLFDLLVVPALMWRRTRAVAFLAVLAFNLTNHWLFSIGIFPWFMMAASTLFFAPDWPRRVLAKLGLRTEPDTATDTACPRPLPRWGRVALAAWVAVQLALPLRHHLYPGDPNWTDEGHRFAWHMKLRDKSAQAVFHVIDLDTGEQWEEDPFDYLEDWQVRKMVIRPDLILQFAHILVAVFESTGHPGVEVRAQVAVSLNGRPPALLIDPDADLAAVRRSLRPAGWILPLTVPLPAR